MAEYHIGCGLAGIYAGTLNRKNKDGYRTWRDKSDVTEEAIEAVARYLGVKLKYDNEKESNRKYMLNDGAMVELNVSIMEDGEREESAE